MTEKHNDVVLKDQLAALHDVSHNRMTPDGIPVNLCSDCESNWLCPIHEISSMLLLMTGESSDWPDGCLNGYIDDKNHTPYNPRLLNQQLDLICQERKAEHMCSGCFSCPVIRIRQLMQLCETDTQSKPENKYLTKTPATIRIILHFTPDEFQIAAEISLPKSVKPDAIWDEIYGWQDKYVKRHSEIREDLRVTSPKAITINCTITPKKKFTVEIPMDMNAGNQEEYVREIMDRYFKNIKSWKAQG